MLTNSVFKPIHLKNTFVNENIDYMKEAEVKHMTTKVGYEAANDSKLYVAVMQAAAKMMAECFEGSVKIKQIF
jgi:hypothetical protein